MSLTSRRELCLPRIGGAVGTQERGVAILPWVAAGRERVRKGVEEM
jgi:hypothetical protein